MDVLTDLIKAMGLDRSFFYQLAIITATYIVVKNLFLKQYCSLLEKRRQLTKGKFDNSKKLEETTAELKSLYETKAAQINKDFQNIFGDIKQKTEKDFNEQKIQFQKEQVMQTESQKKSLLKKQKEQEMELQKDLPSLVKILVDKIKGPA